MRSLRQGVGPSLVLFLCLFAAQAALLVLSPILPQVATEFGVTISAAAQLRSVSGVTAGLTAALLATRANRTRLDRLLRSGVALLGLGSAVSALSPTFGLLLAAQLLIGIGLGMVLSGGLAAAEVWARHGDGTRVLSWALVGQPVAWVVGQPVAGAVAELDWRWAWVAVPVVGSVAAGAALWARADGGGTLEDCALSGLWKERGLKGWAAGELAAFSGWAGLLVYAGAFFIDTYGIGTGTTGLVLGLVALCYLPGNFLVRRLLPDRVLAVLGAAATGLAGGAVVFGGLRPGVAFSAVALGALAFFAGARTIAGASAGLQLSGGRRLAAMSIRTAALQFGYLAGTALGGLVLPQWGYAGVGVLFGTLFAVSGTLQTKSTGAALRSPTGHQA